MADNGWDAFPVAGQAPAAPADRAKVGNDGLAMAVFLSFVGAANLKNFAAGAARKWGSHAERALNMAEDLKKAGATPDEILSITSRMNKDTPFSGVQYTRDNKPILEMSDADIQFKGKSIFDTFEKAKTEGKQRLEGKIGDFFQADNLFAAFPEIRNTQIRLNIEPGIKPEDRGGFALYKKEGKSYVEINAGSMDDLKDVFIHEKEHLGQGIEGLSKGASVNLFARTLMEPLIAHIWKEKDAFRQQMKNAADLGDWKLYNELQAKNEAFYNGVDGLFVQGNAYKRSEGEVLARQAQLRADMTGEELRANPARPDINPEAVISWDGTKVTSPPGKLENVQVGGDISWDTFPKVETNFPKPPVLAPEGNNVKIPPPHIDGINPNAEAAKIWDEFPKVNPGN